MKWGEAAAISLAFGAWRLTGSVRAGTVLARALASPDETNRTAAGILLVRGGARALPLLRENLQQGVAVALSLRVLGDIGGPEAAAMIEPYQRDSDPRIAAAARSFSQR